MSDSAADEGLCQAVLGFVTEGTYPDDNVVAGNLAPAALSRELELISKAREQVEVLDFLSFDSPS